MRYMIAMRNRIASIMLMVMVVAGMFSGIIPETQIDAKAATSYKVLLWVPDATMLSDAVKALKAHISKINGINVTVVDKLNSDELTAQDMDGIQLVYIMAIKSAINSDSSYSLLGTNNNNAILLKNFVESGGRIIMNGEHSGFRYSNAALSALAHELGGQFTIEDEASGAMQIDLNTTQKTELTAGCEKICPVAYAPITSTNATAVWLMRDSSKKVFAVDQVVKQGRITAFADVNWLYPSDADAYDAATQFLENLLKDSAGNIAIVNVPTITVQPQDLTWYYGDSTVRTLSITATSPNNGNLTYQWYRGNTASFTPDNSNEVTGATSASYAIPNPETVPVGVYYYKCIVTNTLGGLSDSVTSDAATVTVLEVKPPVINIQPNDLTWYYGDATVQTLTITATSPDNGTLTYQWYKGNSADFTPGSTNIITGATSDSYAIPSPETIPVGKYYYKCVVSNINNGWKATVISNAATVTVLEPETQMEPAKVVTIPSPKHLIYNGSVQELITPGTASGGTMKYALGTASNAPQSGWSTSIPKGTSIGTYYIWYMVVGEDGREDSAQGRVVSTIAQDLNQGDIATDVETHENTPDTSVQGLTEDLAWGVTTPEEQADINNNGTKGRLWLEITNIDSTVDAGDKQLIESRAQTLNEAKVGMYLDFSMYFQVGNKSKRQLADLNGVGISVEVAIPAYLRSSGTQRTFYLVSVHNGVIKIHGSTMGDKIKATLTEFSTYAIIYADGEEEEVFKVSVKIKQTDEKIVVDWDKVDGVGKVEVYVAYCGTKYSKKPAMTTTTRKVTIKKINGKKLNQKRNYKMYLIAYDKKGNRIGKTLSLHFGGKNCKYTNPKKLKLSTNNVTLSVGQSTKVIGKITYENKKKKPLSIKHAARFRYVSDNPAIAAVDKNGNITGVTPGVTYVYVICQNGLSKKVKVTVN